MPALVVSGFADNEEPKIGRGEGKPFFQRSFSSKSGNIDLSSEVILLKLLDHLSNGNMFLRLYKPVGQGQQHRVENHSRFLKKVSLRLT